MHRATTESPQSHPWHGLGWGQLTAHPPAPLPRARRLPPCWPPRAPSLGASRNGAPTATLASHATRTTHDSFLVPLKPALGLFKAIPLVPSLHPLTRRPSPAFLQPPVGTGRPPQGLPGAFSRLNAPSPLSCLLTRGAPAPQHPRGLRTRSNISTAAGRELSTVLQIHPTNPRAGFPKLPGQRIKLKTQTMTQMMQVPCFSSLAACTSREKTLGLMKPPGAPPRWFSPEYPCFLFSDHCRSHF